MQKTTILRLLACTLLSMIVALLSAPSFAAVTTSIIRGTVTAGGNPVSGVNVRLFSPRYEIPIDATKTDANGEYAFADVALGNYKVTTQIAGYQDRDAHIDVAQEITNVVDFDLAAQPPREEVNIEKVPVSSSLGCVEGCILDVKAVPGQTTILCLVDNNKCIYAVTEPDAQGRFTFPLIPPGNYRLEFQHPGYSARQTSVSVSAGLIHHRNYSPASGWSVPFNFFGTFDPSDGGYVHLRGSDENNVWGNAQLSRPNYETTAPSYGTAVLIR